MIHLIETKNFSRSFGKAKVVNDLNLSVKAGEVFGFLGPNGAGKTTTVRMLTCLIEPSGGTAFVDGLDVSKPKEAMQIRSRVGLLTETPGMYDTLSAYKNLRFYGRLYDVEEPKLGGQIEHYLKLLGALGTRRTSRWAASPRACGRRWRSRAACCMTRRCCSSTSRLPAWTRRHPASCVTSSWS